MCLYGRHGREAARQLWAGSGLSGYEARGRESSHSAADRKSVIRVAWTLAENLP
ncbi:hypothetical protein M2281_003758 [Mesorhizobium soli]|nr:hypothetical protein [Mesorhizobium soli]